MGKKRMILLGGKGKTPQTLVARALQVVGCDDGYTLSRLGQEQFGAYLKKGSYQPHGPEQVFSSTFRQFSEDTELYTTVTELGTLLHDYNQQGSAAEGAKVVEYVLDATYSLSQCVDNDGMCKDIELNKFVYLPRRSTELKKALFKEFALGSPNLVSKELHKGKSSSLASADDRRYTKDELKGIVMNLNPTFALVSAEMRAAKAEKELEVWKEETKHTQMKMEQSNLCFWAVVSFLAFCFALAAFIMGLLKHEIYMDAAEQDWFAQLATVVLVGPLRLLGTGLATVLAKPLRAVDQLPGLICYTLGWEIQQARLILSQGVLAYIMFRSGKCFLSSLPTRDYVYKHSCLSWLLKKLYRLATED